MIKSRSTAARLPISQSTVRPQFTLFDWMAVFVLTAFSAMRFGVGTDFFLYTRLFDEIDPESYSYSIANSPQEVGYTTLAFLLRQLSDSTLPLFWVTSIITVVPVYAMIKKHSDNTTLAIFLYIALAFYLTPLNVVRQGVAISINYYASQYVDSRRKRFIFLNLLAASFHSSVVVIAVLQYLFRKVKPSWGFFLMMILTSCVGYFVVSSGFVVNVIASLNSRYGSYVDPANFGGGIGTVLLIFVHVLLVVVSLLLPTNSEIARNQSYFMLALPFFVVGLVSTPAARLEEYLSIFIVLALPNQIALLQDQRLCKVLLIIFGLIYMVASLSYFGGLVPYILRT